MLDFSRTRIVESIDYVVQTGYTVTAEGQGLSADYTSGVFGVRPTAGDATDTFIGVSISQQLTLTELPEYILFTNADGTYTLPHTPIGGSILVWNNTAGSVMAFNASPSTGQYNLVGTVLTFNAAQLNNVIRVSYRYVPTTLEALTVAGDIPRGGAANLVLGTMGTVQKGQVATSFFDTSVNWLVAKPVLTQGANGRFTLAGGSALPVPGAVIVSLPSDTDPWLVFEI